MKLSLKFLSFVVFSVALIAMSLGVALSAGTPVVTPGSDPSAVHLGAVRYRELATGADSEVYLGIPDLGDAARRTETNLTWGASNAITLTYDSVLDKLSTTMHNGTTEWTLEYPSYSDNVRDLVFGGSQALADEALSKLNYMQIDIRLQEGTPAQVSLDNVSLDSNPLGNFTGVNKATTSWQVNGYDLSSGFTITGTLNMANVTSPSAELNWINITFGNVDADTFAPTVSSVAVVPNPQTGGGIVTLTATVDDSSSGGSLIQSADYKLGTGAWTPMGAADGNFDSPTENVTAVLAAPVVDGPYNLCVRGTDSASNTSADQCITLNVDSLGPITSAVAVLPLKVGGGVNVDLTATVDDSTTGGSDIQSAEYSLNGVDWSPMAAQDGTFDSPSEAVSASFTSPAAHGDVDVCVRGTDAAGNTGSQSCTILTVDSMGPLTSAVFLDPNPADALAQVTLTADVDDSTTGNSNLASAEYQVTGGTWSPMAAQDGTFDSPNEAVIVQFAAPDSPPFVEICVRGSDGIGNTGSAICDQLEVTGIPAGPVSLYLPIQFRDYTNP